MKMLQNMPKRLSLKIYNYHPDMNPVNMKDGNILVQYNHPAFNVVLREFAEKYMTEIEANHLRALATDEVLMTPGGANVFDQFGMLALYGRTFMFMDAQNPKIVKYIGKKLTKVSIDPWAVAPFWGGCATLPQNSTMAQGQLTPALGISKREQSE